MRNQNIVRLFIILLIGAVIGMFTGGFASAADCVPQAAVATTYKTVLNPEYVPAVEEKSHVITVVDEAAYDEQVLVTAEQTIKHDAIPPTTTVYPPVFVPAVTHEVFHPAVTHVVHHDAVYTKVQHDAVYGTEYEYKQFITGKTKWRDTAAWNGYDGLSWGWYYTGNSRSVVLVEAWCENVLVTAAWDETVVDSAAWTETVIDAEAYTIPGYEVLNEDGVDAWTEVIPAVYTTVHHDAVTHEETVIDVEAADAIGEETITVVDDPGTSAVVCLADVPVSNPTPTETPVVALVADPISSVPANNSELAHTGSAWDNVAPYALGFLMLGIVLAVTAFFGRRYDRKHLQQL